MKIKSLFLVFGKFLRSFISISFLLFSLMYLMPGVTKFKTHFKWPVSYLVWLYNFFTFNTGYNEIYFYFFRTLFLVFGSLFLSFLFVLFILLLKKILNENLTKLIVLLVNISSGFHILILGIMYYFWKNTSGLNFGLFIILALGNGSFAEMYNTFETEIENILSKEYSFAAKAWGKNKLKFAIKELIISTTELLIARLPILFGNTIIIELLFTVKGISYLIFFSIQNRDFNMLIISTVLVALVIIIFNIISERIRYLLDPRIKYAN